MNTTFTTSRSKDNMILFFVLAAFITTSSFMLLKKSKPVLYIIGDSTVRNGDGSGRNGQWGWGSFLSQYFDTTKISVQNHALGGRSSRTFITEGRWEKILGALKKDDYVIIQFGHNDAGALDDTARARGTIKGIGEETKEIYNPIMKKQEIVHSYGWYMRKYVRETKSKGAIPIVCSLVPRTEWEGGKVKRSNDGYARWAQEVARAEGAYFIDLNNLIADQYDRKGQQEVEGLFKGDHTHTSEAGARMNVAILVKELKKQKPGKLKKYLL